MHKLMNTRRVDRPASRRRGGVPHPVVTGRADARRNAGRIATTIASAIALVGGNTSAADVAAPKTTAASGAAVTADSLLGTFGEILKMYHMYSASDGRTYIEVMDVPPMKTPIGLVTYFDRQVRRVVIGHWEDGEFTDYHYAVNQNLLIYLQGTQIITTGDGKEYRLEPGMAVLAEDWTGKGHTNRCVAPDKQKVCLLLQITIGDIDKSLPLRPPPAATNAGAASGQGGAR